MRPPITSTRRQAFRCRGRLVTPPKPNASSRRFRKEAASTCRSGRRSSPRDSACASISSAFPGWSTARWKADRCSVVGKANGSRERAPDDKLRVPTKPDRYLKCKIVGGTGPKRLCPPCGSSLLVRPIERREFAPAQEQEGGGQS